MNEAENTSPLGFLTAVELAEIGFCGGLLLLNERGRPLEFHCNSPIQPSRTQHILYGSTLRSFLLTEAIALRLVEKCSKPPAAILTNLPELWELSRHVAMPIGLVPTDQTSSDLILSTDGANRWKHFEIASQAVAVATNEPDRRVELEALLQDFAQRLPLAEPFQRIQNAIDEAHSSARLRESA